MCQILGPFVHELKASIVDAVFNDEFGAVPAELHALEATEFDFEDDYDDNDDNGHDDDGSGVRDAHDANKAHQHPRKSSEKTQIQATPEIVALRRALIQQDKVFGRSPMHYAVRIATSHIHILTVQFGPSQSQQLAPCQAASESQICADVISPCYVYFAFSMFQYRYKLYLL